jgi:choline dehydrogenase
MTVAHEVEFDYVVIGAGTAGCLLANRLSADASARVCLIEAGGTDNYHWIHIPVGYLYCINNPRTDWLYKTQPEPGLNGRSLIYPRGRVLGGSSSINGMIYMRGQRQDYDHWAALGNPGWAWDDVLPYFKQHEDYHRGADDLHGAGHEWRVDKQRLSWEILDAFRDAAVQAGLPRNDDFNRGNNEGVGYFEVNQKAGVRWNASKAFLRPVAGRRNLQVMVNAQAQHLLFDGLRCTGVRVRRGDGSIANLQARREVVLAAGSVGSPGLLERSGIGQPEVLASAGVQVRRALQGVGENLQDHLQLRMVFKVRNVKTLNSMAHSLLGKARIGLEYVLSRSGPMSMAPSQLGAFARSSDAHARANVQYHVQPLSLNAFGQPLHRFNAFTASVCNLRPSSRGSIHIDNAQAQAAPRIVPNYLSAHEDRVVAAQSIKLTRTIVAQQALAKYTPQEFLPGAQIADDEALAQAAGNIGTTIFHPVGTCKMGPAHDAAAVVDAQGRVHGVACLRVADASVMPVITSGNTNSPTLMIAEKIAASMRGQ